MIKSNFFMLKLKDHLEYMKAIQETINGIGDFRGVDPNECKLGNWMYGSGSDDVKKFGKKAQKIFKQLFEPHNQYHLQSKTAIKMFEENNHKKAKKALTEMLLLSNTLSNLLLELDDIANKK